LSRSWNEHAVLAQLRGVAFRLGDVPGLVGYLSDDASLESKQRRGRMCEKCDERAQNSIEEAESEIHAAGLVAVRAVALGVSSMGFLQFPPFGPEYVDWQARNRSNVIDFLAYVEGHARGLLASIEQVRAKFELPAQNGPGEAPVDYAQREELRQFKPGPEIH
jgi:hypothetical protein